MSQAIIDSFQKTSRVGCDLDILDLEWVSWVLLSAGLIGGGAWLWLGIWWLRHQSEQKKIFHWNMSPITKNKSCDQSLLSEKKSSSQTTLSNSQSTELQPYQQLSSSSTISTTPELGATTMQPISLSVHPVDSMWRPPPRESLLHRQQMKIKLGRPLDRIDGPRLRPSPLRPTLPHFPSATPIPLTPSTPSVINLISHDSKIGRKRQGLESLVNLTPLAESESHDDSRNF